MFGVSFAELLVIMVVALLVFGPEKLPEIASQLGKLSFKLKKASDSFRREFYNSVYTPSLDIPSLDNASIKKALIKASDNNDKLELETDQAPISKCDSVKSLSSVDVNQAANSNDNQTTCCNHDDASNKVPE